MNPFVIDDSLVNNYIKRQFTTKIYNVFICTNLRPCMHACMHACMYVCNTMSVTQTVAMIEL